MIKNKSLLLTLFTLLFISCQKEEFTQTGLINDHFYLKSNGQNMPVTVAGNINSGKLLLVVHGGPGGNALAYRNNYVKGLGGSFAPHLRDCSAWALSRRIGKQPATPSWSKAE